MGIRLKRAYDPVAPEDGSRVLVDRVWPRGVTRAQLRINAWLRDLAPSTGLRRWFAHDPAKWGEFRRRYLKELMGKRALIDDLASDIGRRTLTLVYGARDPVHNHAVVIKEVLARRLRRLSLQAEGRIRHDEGRNVE